MNAPTRQWHPHGRAEEEDLAILHNGGDTGWSDSNGSPAPWPQDFLDPNAGWTTRNNTLNAPENPPFYPSCSNGRKLSHNGLILSAETAYFNLTKHTELLEEIFIAVQQARDADETHLSTRALAGYKRRYRTLIAEGMILSPLPPEIGKRGRRRQGPARSLLIRLDKYQTDVLRFAHNFAVPFTNNQAERDVRMIKVQQKISGNWCSTTGAAAFMVVRSYISTANKQGKTRWTRSKNYSRATPGSLPPPE